MEPELDLATIFWILVSSSQIQTLEGSTGAECLKEEAFQMKLIGL